MQEDTKEKPTLGSAIDQIESILSLLDEKSRRIAVNTVCEHLGIEIGGVQTPVRVASGGLSRVVADAQTSAPRITDIRSFARDKTPSSAIERAVFVAYYVAELAPEGERKDSINKEDLKIYFKQAGFPLPKRPEQTLVNARHAGYLDAVGEGRYRLNPVGYNLIAHGLPRQGEGKGGTRGNVRRKGKQARGKSGE